MKRIATYLIQNKHTYAFVALTMLLCWSCKQFIDIPNPENQLISESVFADDNSAIAALNGIYSNMVRTSGGICSSTISLYPSMSADELTYFSTSDRDEFINNQITRVNNTVLATNLWGSAYTLIYAANSCIQGVENSDKLTEGARNMVLGEAYFIRAFVYFNLLNLFGDVPLITTTDYNTNEKMGRTSVEEVKDMIRNDLEQSVELLKEEYPTANRARPNKYAAVALLSRYHLYERNWQLALELADQILSRTEYKLEEDLTSVFVSTSQETIWQIEPVVANRNNWVGFQVLPASSSSAPTYLLTQNLLDTFEEIDKRKRDWVGTRTYRSQTVNYPTKYKVRMGSPAVEFDVVFRVAEILLIKAECEAELGNQVSSIDALNSVRLRAGLNAIHPDIGLENLKHSILLERRKELFTEWGHRWFDLKRTQIIDEVMGEYNPATWQITDALYPIPYSEIDVNPSLIQNPGYE